MAFKNLCIAVLLLTTASIGHAGTIALDIFANTAFDQNNGLFSLGWKFTVNSPITVVALDYYDSTANPDTHSHDDTYTQTPTSLSTISKITYVTDAVVDSASLTFPSGSSGFTSANAAWFGPSFEVSTAGSVPEPSTFALLAGGLALAGLKLRKSRRA